MNYEFEFAAVPQLSDGSKSESLLLSLLVDWLLANNEAIVEHHWNGMFTVVGSGSGLPPEARRAIFGPAESGILDDHPVTIW